MAELTISQTGFSGSNPGLSPRQGILVVTSGPDKASSIVVEGPLISIGTLPDNDFALSDKTISRHHAQLVEHNGQYFIHDLGSTNGTIVNGRKVKEARLELGAVIKLGYTQLAYMPERRYSSISSRPGERSRSSILSKPAERKHSSQPPVPVVSWGGICGCSWQMRALFSMLDRIAPTEATIILEGETGTGKELLARAIHEKSPRAEHPFMVFDCRAIASAMLESELMGYEKGAFPGAIRSRPGVFEQACKGTLFLDEICELDLDLQPKLLRVLENRTVRPVGSAESIGLDVRIIASSGCNLDAQVEAGRFRKDLFYRLAVHRIVIPPLRERREDIPPLAAELLKKLALEYSRSAAPRIAAETVEILKAHDWPGNVRELRNVLSRALSLGCRTVLRPEDLLAQDDERGMRPDLSFEQIEKIAIEQVLHRREGDMQKSARVLGMPRKALFEKIKKYGLS